MRNFEYVGSKPPFYVPSEIPIVIWMIEYDCISFSNVLLESPENLAHVQLFVCYDAPVHSLARRFHGTAMPRPNHVHLAWRVYDNIYTLVCDTSSEASYDEFDATVLFWRNLIAAKGDQMNRVLTGIKAPKKP